MRISTFRQRGHRSLATLDEWIGTFAVFVLAMFQIIIFSWVFGIEKAKAEAKEGAVMNIPAFYWPIIKWVSPLF